MPTDSLRMARIHPGHNGPPPPSNVIPEPAQNRVKNHQDKNQLGFKNQITNDQLGQIIFKNPQDKNNLTLRTIMTVIKNVLKVKFDCMYELL